MADIVNLQKRRKAKARADKDAQAAANRAAFGRTKAEKQLADAAKVLAGRRLEGHRRDDDDGE